MSVKADLNFLELKRSKRSSFRAFGGNAVPNILGKLNAFGDGQVEEIGSGLAHAGSIGRRGQRR